MKNLTEIIYVDVSIGSDIRNAVIEMKEVAIKRGVIVKGDFNGFELEVSIYSDIDNIIEDYRKNIE